VTRPERLLPTALTLALLVASWPAAADLPPPGGLIDLVGPRALGVSAATAGTYGSEAIFVNPAAIGIHTGYVIEGLGVQERRGADTVSRYLGGAVIDAVSSPVAAGFGYLRSMEGPQIGNLYFLTLAGPLAERLHIGLQGRYMKLGGVKPINAVTLDAGLSYEATSLVTIGVAGFNLVPTAHPLQLPQSMGAGLAIGTDTSFRVLADWKGTWLPHGQLANRYAVGADALLGGMLVLRAGWKRDELLATSWWSAGIGLVTPDGFALDVGYKQSFEATSAREMGLSLRYYPPQ
jgi:hypothetical protein